MYDPVNDKQMKNAKIGDSIYLSREEYTAVSEALIRVPEYETPLVENGFPVKVVGRYDKQYEYRTLSRTGQAQIVQYPSDFPALAVNKDYVTVKIPWIGISYELQNEEIGLTREKGEAIDTTYAVEAARETMQKREEALWSSSSQFGTLGIYGQAGDTFSSAADWSTATTNIYEQVRLWISTIDKRYRMSPLRLVLADTQYQETKKSIWNNGSINVMIPGGNWYNQIKEAYPRLEILNEPQATAGTGVLYPFNENVAKLVSAVPLLPIDIDESAQFITQAAAVKEVLVVPTPSVVVKTASI